jgi:acetolactate synthase-1/3 small subunit
VEKVVLSLLVANEFGVLTRVTNLFSQRGFNIDTVASGISENPLYQRITITTHGDAKIINQIKLQVAKLEDVKAVVEIPADQLFYREVVLIKVAPKSYQMRAFQKIVQDFGGKCVIVDDNFSVVEITDTPASIDYFVEEMQEFSVKEICRTGGAAMQLTKEFVD